MSWEKWYDIFLEEMKNAFAKAPDISPVHKTDHIIRVWERSKVLCEKMGGDLEVMVAAVLLHDLARHYGLEIHGKKSAEMAEPVLAKHNFPKDKTPKVLEAIAQHDYTFPPEKRTLLEAKILYDTDKLDVLGVIGIYRYIRFYMAERDASIDDILELIEKRQSGLSLPESEALGKKDYEYAVNFFKVLKKELGKGED